MKYFPLIWTALWRKPARTILTFLAAVAAFTLFGLAIGLNATYSGIVAQARADRVNINPHFIENGNLTLAQRERIARMPEIRAIGVSDFFLGYYRDPKNQIRSEEHTSELQSRRDLVCRLLLEKKKKKTKQTN